MALALQLAGVLGSMWLVATALRGLVSGSLSSALALMIVPAVLATVVVANGLWPTLRSLALDARHDAALTRAQAAAAGSSALGANAAFLSWVADQLPEHATYFLIEGPNVTLWATFQLLPRRSVSSLRDAQWLVFYGQPSTAAGAARPFFGRERIYARGLGIAPRR
jgi:hypothetical protein